MPWTMGAARTCAAAREGVPAAPVAQDSPWQMTKSPASTRMSAKDPESAASSATTRGVPTSASVTQDTSLAPTRVHATVSGRVDMDCNFFFFFYF